MNMGHTCPLCRAKTPTSHEEAVKQLRPWVKKKKAWALQMMAQIYRDGEGVKQSYEMARRLFEQAAQQRYATAMSCLGNLYANGQGVEQSYEKAVEYYEQAADLGHASAQYYLGRMYQFGKGVKRSSLMAKELYELAIQQEYVDAMVNLGAMYANGNTKVEKNIVKARDLWNKAEKHLGTIQPPNISRCSMISKEKKHHLIRTLSSVLFVVYHKQKHVALINLNAHANQHDTATRNVKRNIGRCTEMIVNV